MPLRPRSTTAIQETTSGAAPAASTAWPASSHRCRVDIFWWIPVQYLTIDGLLPTAAAMLGAYSREKPCMPPRFRMAFPTPLVNAETASVGTAAVARTAWADVGVPGS